MKKQNKSKIEKLRVIKLRRKKRKMDRVLRGKKNYDKENELHMFLKEEKGQINLMRRFDPSGFSIFSLIKKRKEKKNGKSDENKEVEKISGEDALKQMFELNK